MTAPWDRRSAAEQQRVADLALGEWLPTATAAAPLWARHAEGAGLAPRELRSRQDLLRLPTSRELDLLTDGPGASGAVLRPSEEQVKSFVSVPLLRRVAAAARREGREGKRTVLLREYQPLDLRRAGAEGDTVVASSRSDLDRWNRAGARAAAVLGLDERDVLLGALPAGPTLAAARATHLAQGASVAALHARGPGDGLDAVAGAAALVRPTAILVPVEEAEALVRVLADARAGAARLRLLILDGPPPDEALRGRLGDALAGLTGHGVEVRALWGPPFGRTLWAECDAGHGLHTMPDLEVVEVVDPVTGAPTSGDGDLTLTSLGWHGTVLLRLRTGTWVDPLRAEPCPGCGRTVPRLVGELAPEAWHVRLRGDGGRPVGVDLRGVDAVLGTLAGASTWRAEVRGPTDRVPRDRLVVEVAGELARAERDGLEQRLEAACGIAPHLTLGVPAEEIERAVAQLGGHLADAR